MEIDKQVCFMLLSSPAKLAGSKYFLYMYKHRTTPNGTPTNVCLLLGAGSTVPVMEVEPWIPSHEAQGVG